MLPWKVKRMRYIFLFFLALGFIGISMPVYANSWGSNMMRFEDDLVDDVEVYGQMQEYMQNLFEGDLTEEERSQMLEWMQSNIYQTAMMSMMMRTMNSNASLGWGGMMSSWGGFGWMSSAWLITTLLVWGFLLSGIFAFWKSIQRPRK